MKKVFIILSVIFSLNVNSQVKDSTNVDSFQKTDEILSEVVKKTLIVAEKTGDFVIEQAPMLLREFYNWHMVSDIFGILIALIILLISRYLPHLWLPYKESQGQYSNKFFSRYGVNDFHDDLNIPAWIIFIGGSLIAIVMFFITAYDLTYLIVAPKLYLIEHFIK